MLVLNLIVNTKGQLDALVLKPHKNKAIQEEISRILNSILSYSPPQHEGKAVVVKGFILPINM